MGGPPGIKVVEVGPVQVEPTTKNEVMVAFAGVAILSNSSNVNNGANSQRNMSVLLGLSHAKTKSVMYKRCIIVNPHPIFNSLVYCRASNLATAEQQQVQDESTDD